MEGSENVEGLIREVYPELREMAARLLRGERDNHTLQRTALVHETFIRLFGKRQWEDLSSQSLLALAAKQMRQILIDHGRKHRAKKRGGDFSRVPLFDADIGSFKDEDSLIALNTALEQLGELDKRALSIVELKFFGGFTNAEAAAILGVSDATVESDWQFARTWLYGFMTRKQPEGQQGSLTSESSGQA